MVGRSAPDFELADGSKLGEHLKLGKGILLDFKKLSPLHDLMQPFARQITYIASEAKEQLGLEAGLIRPDGFVAWVGDGHTHYRGFTETALRWFGES
ncbi:hypothetical protein RMR16_017105 [Agrobacterium sp. rho-13.3]|uniref:aromatic-ring hydroxylase C-terminal domain-containing protein n=1 Tax=Agrobacterium sp. rho-13.3 TaxID=3072980 RepID=UPI0039B78671